MALPLTSTIAEAKEWLRSRVREGATCPVCDQRVQVYRRSINSAMARGLIDIYRSVEVGVPFHMPTVAAALGGDAARLSYWGLITEEPVQRPDMGRAGWWSLTPEGAGFARGHHVVTKYALVYNSRVLGFEGPTVDIRSCLGNRFDLQVLLNGG